MRIIPAIDIINGEAVRLSKGDYNQKIVYEKDPRILAKRFEVAGLKNLHIVDLDGAKAGKPINHQLIADIAKNSKLNIDVGGGIKKAEDVGFYLDAGVKQITAGSVAVKNPDEVKNWFADFGASKIILGLDVLNDQIKISGWLEDGGIKWVDLIEQYLDVGLEYLISTDISKDGMLAGPSIELYEAIQIRYPKLKVIASGGVSKMEDINTLKTMNLNGVIVGKAIYEGRIKLEELC
jgi:phosphoribosylformimino-5-aminoimidazole carboxamide ribotide isomerase